MLAIDTAIVALPRCSPRMEVRRLARALRMPFRISDHVFESVDTIVVRLRADGHTGIGEAAGVYYLGDEPAGMMRMLQEARPPFEDGLDHAALLERLPPGGARNALDCALWDLQARRLGTPVWRLLGMAPPAPLLTTFTLGADDPAAMAQRARDYGGARAIKVKLAGDEADAARVAAVRAARADVWLGVDANRSLTRPRLDRLLPDLVAADVRLVEQPLPIGDDAQLAGMASPIPLAADESVHSLADLERVAPFYQAVNIKLDKCGGLTAGIRQVQRARALGLTVMVGNTIGTSLAMAPAFLLGQLCEIVDLDGPILLREDCRPAARYDGGYLDVPDGLWGSPGSDDDVREITA